MKALSINEIKKELEKKNSKELVVFCLRLAKYKKDNKELLRFLLFENEDIPSFIENAKQENNSLFENINKSNIYYVKKSVRKILKNVNKQIRFSSLKQVEAELLIHFCNCIVSYSVPLKQGLQLMNLYETQLIKIEDVLSELHPDLQYDLRRQILK